MASHRLFPTSVMPVVASFTLAYPTMFLMGLWHTTSADGEVEPKGRRIATGPMVAGWRYDITERSFPAEGYRVHMTYSVSAANVPPMCVLEVRDGPRPEKVTPGPGSVVYVTFEEPLKGDVTRSIAVNLADSLEAECAAMVDNDVRVPPEAANDKWLTVVRHAPAERMVAAAPGG